MNAHFVIVEIQQRTREWLEWRHEGVGASGASTIMDENPYRGAVELLQEKRGPARASSQNEAMALGTILGPEARRRYIAETGKNVRPVCVQSTRYDWLRASLSGLATNNDSVFVIKCGRSVYQTVSVFRSVPNYYYGQVQHILAVTGLDSVDFWCYWPGQPELFLSVERDDSYIERLLDRELEFWNQVQRKV